jgi:phage terminase large subunit GpA-like protein
MAHKIGEKVADYPGILYLRRSAGWHLRQHRCHIDTNPMRMEAQRSFLRKPNEPGAAHLPSGLGKNQSDMTYLQHLCGEKWEEKKMKWEKSKGGGRWDWLDCRTYNMAMHRFHLLTFNKPRPKRVYGNIGTL